MTAEVAIMNKAGVALAADSAMTVGGTGGPKIYNSVNKLFGLSKYHPVGIMVYGSAALSEVPWETIIKTFRKMCGRESFETVEEWAKDFLRFLGNEGGLVPLEVQQASMAIMIARVLRDTVEETTKRAGAPGDPAFHDALRTVTARACTNLEAMPFLSGYDEAEVGRVAERYNDAFNRGLESALPIAPPADVVGLLRRALALLICKNTGQKGYSGVVIAGFGDKQVFPALSVFEVSCVENGVPRLSMQATRAITFAETALVLPFAQKELVCAFMEGVEPGYQTALDDRIKETLIQKYPELIATALQGVAGLPPDLRERLALMGTGLMEELQKHAENLRLHERANRITQAVALLPKDELASLAESLVTLTSLKKRVSLDAETVGGPVDVVVISKGDGLVWMKRKHYFKADLNPHFFTNYFQEGSHE